MDQRQLRQADEAVGNFLKKRVRVNEPLQGFVATAQGKQFRNQIRNAIASQGKWVEDHIGRFVDDGKAPDRAALATRLQKEMPPVSEYLKMSSVTAFLKASFEYSVVAQYKRQGITVKAAPAFQLTNAHYIAALKSQASYLLHRSSLDQTTRDGLITIIINTAEQGATVNEVASAIAGSFPDVTESRADAISRTELAQSMGSGNFAAMQENGVQTKRWITAGENPCEICIQNEAAGEIKIDEVFPSGDLYEPAHPNDECYTEGGEIDLEPSMIWFGD